ncbi:MAG TPA: SRPBCC domain-containing protein [Prolixibacteraceae bacterium]|nr:SRPBCC domain-containing protein [Prolixibacteraceae bacterium]
MQNEPFVIEKVYNTSAVNVWKAITNSKEMRQWYFDIPGFRAEPGFEFQFISDPREERPYRHICQVTEVVICKRLSYSWQYNRYDTVTSVIFELTEEEDNRTRIRLSHEGLDAYPDSDPDFSKESFAEGWTWIIGTALKEYMEKVYSASRVSLKMEV